MLYETVWAEDIINKVPDEIKYTVFRDAADENTR